MRHSKNSSATIFRPMMRAGIVMAFVLNVVASCPAHAAAPAQGGSCTGSLTAAADATGNNLVCVSSVWQYVPYWIGDNTAGDGNAVACTTAGQLRWNATNNQLQYCDGSYWYYFNTTSNAYAAGCGSTSGTVSTPSSVAITVHAGCAVTFKTWGAGGGSGGSDGSNQGAPGGGGGYATTSLTPPTDTTFYITVGYGGLGGRYDFSGSGTNAGGPGGGGGAGSPFYRGGSGNYGGPGTGGGGGGGAATTICMKNYCGFGNYVSVLVAGAGGGGTGSNSAAGYAGGTGTQVAGQTIGGSAARANACFGCTGGGGGGGGDAAVGAGSAGGTSTPGSGGSSNGIGSVSTTAGSGTTPGNSADGNRPSNAGTGAAQPAISSDGIQGYPGATYYSW